MVDRHSRPPKRSKPKGRMAGLSRRYRSLGTPPRCAPVPREADGLTAVVVVVVVVVQQQGATNKMVVLSSSHPALPADASVSSSSTSTQSSLRPPASAPQYVQHPPPIYPPITTPTTRTDLRTRVPFGVDRTSLTRSPQQSAPSTPMLSPRSSSQPTSPNPYGESDRCVKPPPPKPQTQTLRSFRFVSFGLACRGCRALTAAARM
jgi:hypothetical protein